MKYYDLVFDTCEFSDEFAKRLGFERVFSINEKGAALSIGSDKQKLMMDLQKGASTLAITDFMTDKRLLSKVKEKEAILCIPFSMIIGKEDFERSRLLYKASTLARYAISNRIELALASFARSTFYMNSYMQLIELAKLIGIKEDYARNSISATNKKLGELCDKD